jgi:putative hemolysin
MRPALHRLQIARALPPRLSHATSPAISQGELFGRLGPLEVRLVNSRRELRIAQRLRYEVFYREMSAQASLTTHLRRLDEDELDAVCDHLLVFDTAADEGIGSASRIGGRRPKGVGTYRLLRQDVAARNGGFYSEGEFDIAPLIARRSPGYRFLELGRSCVLKPYRTKRTVELLWEGLWSYARRHHVDVMIGCASFEGTDPAAHAQALSFLHHNRLAPPEWRAAAHPHLRVGMDMLPKDRIDAKAALKALPPLIKGYLRLGAFVGDGAVVDHQFGTTDVLIVLPVEAIDPRYFGYFGAPSAEQKSAFRPALS